MVCLGILFTGAYLTVKVMQQSLENNADPDCTLCDGRGWYVWYTLDGEDVTRECDCVRDKHLL